MTDNKRTFRFGLWPTVLAISVPLAVLFGTQAWSKQRGDISLRCAAPMFVSGQQEPKQVLLQLKVRGGKAELLYGIERDGRDLGALRLTGKLIDWEPASLSYHLSLDKGQLLMDFTQTQLPEHLRQAMLIGREPLMRGEALPVSFQLLERHGSRALLGIADSSALWSCEVKKQGPMG